MPGPAIERSSLVRASAVRIPPMEKVKNSFSGKATMTLFVRSRWPCQWRRSSAGVMIADGVEWTAELLIIRYLDFIELNTSANLKGRCDSSVSGEELKKTGFVLQVIDTGQSDGVVKK